MVAICWNVRHLGRTLVSEPKFPTQLNIGKVPGGGTISLAFFYVALDCSMRMFKECPNCLTHIMSVGEASLDCIPDCTSEHYTHVLMCRLSFNLTKISIVNTELS